MSTIDKRSLHLFVAVFVPVFVLPTIADFCDFSCHYLLHKIAILEIDGTIDRAN